MHSEEYSNWVKIKKTFEESGNTDNYFYVRACAIVDGKPDPIVNLSNVK
jgi:ribosomal protein S19E (S16A)|tara:strand:- start:91 stop:237 length:147 start_codon:yes stop_codon:yes gene_type:complete